MSRELLRNVIGEFDLHRFKRFFSEKNRKFKESSDNLDYPTDDIFTGVKRLGTLDLEDGRMIVCAIEVKKELTERSGKKAQYELGKKILKATQMDAGIFIFYDRAKAFRFSLIYADYLGKKRDWSSFKRCTYYVNKDLANKTFRRRIGDGDFSSLAKIKDAFSVEKVTKEFYQDIANWYFWAVENCQFPKDAETETNGRNIAVIRLITRIIFIWFMRERELVPRELFDETKVSEILKDMSDDKSTYYHAILQNLFFATLSTPREQRKFRTEVRGHKGYNPDFGNQNVYRYHELFKNPDKIKDYFGEIPFLNGGLFECLDDKPNDIYIDGFTDVKKHQPVVPNFLFFGPEKSADLNAIYGTKGKKFIVRGLLSTLSSYNFTIDENTLDDQDVALDPELLGRVFENLLASYNPETSTTARKATGSYYTPREIVDYMVTESLKAYFKTHLAEITEIDKKLDDLFSPANTENPFDEKESNRIVDLIENVRIVDPAVGSGAFPMGALNKLVFILGKLDPGNELWKKAQLDVANDIPDANSRKAAVAAIEKNFREKNVDYLRKLYLIQKCIYGVDIQEIAVEIAKLRFFISLLVDERIDPAKENMGIEPLPNLDFKIMQGNSLISEFMGIDFDNGADKQEKNGQATLGISSEDEGLIKEFERKKIDFQNEPDRDKKAALKKEIEDLMIEIFEARLRKKYAEIKAVEDKAKSILNAEKRKEYIKSEQAKLSKKLGLDLDDIEKQLRELTRGMKTKQFFPWKLYFAEVFEKGGFDIVIGNPPYGFRNVLSSVEKKFYKKEKNIVFPSGDIAEIFILISYDKLVRARGVQTFIIPKKSLYGESWVNVRKFWITNKLNFLMDASKAFQNVLLEQISFSLIKQLNTNDFVTIGALDQGNELVRIFGAFSLKSIFTEDMRNAQIYRGLCPESILNKIDSLSEFNTSRFIRGEIGISNITEHLTFKRDGNYPCIKGIDIFKYGLKKERYLEGSIARRFTHLYRGDKLVAQEIIAHVQNPNPHIKITIFYDKSDRLINDTCVEIKILHKSISAKFIMAYFQSTFCNWYAYNFIYNRAIRTMHLINYYIAQIPLPRVILEDRGRQEPFMKLVDKIISLTDDEDYLLSLEKQRKVHEYEKRIDRLVYELYGLTPEEIAVVEGKTI